MKIATAKGKATVGKSTVGKASAPPACPVCRVACRRHLRRSFRCLDLDLDGLACRRDVPRTVWRCPRCLRFETTVDEPGLRVRRRYGDRLVSRALELHRGGGSLAYTSERLEAETGARVPPTTIHDWIVDAD